MTKMTLDEFAEAERRRLEAFKRWWRRRNVDEPAVFPLSMLPGDWDEQLNLFEEKGWVDEPKGHPGDKITKTTCYIREDQHERLQELSRRTGVPMADYIRQGVGELLKQEGFE